MVVGGDENTNDIVVHHVIVTKREIPSLKREDGRKPPIFFTFQNTIKSFFVVNKNDENVAWCFGVEGGKNRGARLPGTLADGIVEVRS